MDIFKHFSDREELLKAVSDAIQNEGNEFFLVPPETKGSEELQKRLNEVNAENKKFRQSNQERKTRIQELETELEDKTAQMAALEKLNPENLREQLHTVSVDKASLETKLPRLQKTIEELQSKVDGYESRERESKIKSMLWDAAKNEGVRDDAKIDVEYMWRDFQLNDAGLLETTDKRDMMTVLRDRIAHSPHWLPLSAGGKSAPGTGTQSEDPYRRFADFEKNGDFDGMMAEATKLAASLEATKPEE